MKSLRTQSKFIANIAISFAFISEKIQVWNSFKKIEADEINPPVLLLQGGTLK